MDLEGVAGIRRAEFEGFKPISELMKSGCCEVPKEPGVYIVLRENSEPPRFLDRSTGGHYKGIDPTVEKHVLEEKWEGVPRAIVLYIGKAGPGKTANLMNRLRKFVRFGQGKPVAHRGGRYIWQMCDSGDLLVCWKSTRRCDPREMEKTLICEFEGVYGHLPFANLVH